MAHIYTAV